MNEFIEWYSTKTQELHPVERDAMVQIIFVGIHPFVDRNGRTSRLLLNLELMKNGYPPIVIKNANRLEYYAALDKAYTTGENSDLISLVMKETNDMLDCYISLCNNNF